MDGTLALAVRVVESLGLSRERCAEVATRLRGQPGVARAVDQVRVSKPTLGFGSATVELWVVCASGNTARWHVSAWMKPDAVHVGATVRRHYRATDWEVDRTLGDWPVATFDALDAALGQAVAAVEQDVAATDFAALDDPATADPPGWRDRLDARGRTASRAEERARARAEHSGARYHWNGYAGAVARVLDTGMAALDAVWEDAQRRGTWVAGRYNKGDSPRAYHEGYLDGLAWVRSERERVGARPVGT